MSKCNSLLSACKSQVIAQGCCCFIGLDVHKKKTYAAIRAGGDLIETWDMPACPPHVVATLEIFREIKHKIAYEDGPTG